MNCAAGVTKQVSITPDLHPIIQSVWDPQAHNDNVVMLWAVCCFVCFMCIRELTVPNDDIYDTLYHLSWSDMMDNDPVHPSRLEMHYKGLYNEPISSGHLDLLAK